jgi:hypothetical protein
MAINAVRKRRLKNTGLAVWKAVKPAAKAYATQVVTAAAEDLATKAGMSDSKYAKYMPKVDVASLMGNGLYLAGRGRRRRKRTTRKIKGRGLTKGSWSRKTGEYLPKGYVLKSHKGTQHLMRVVKSGTSNRKYLRKIGD